MKTKLTLLLIIFCVINIYAQNIPTITFQTNKVVGTPITMILRLTTSGTVIIDWGDGNIVNQNVATTSTVISGVLVGNVVKVYGSDLNYFECVEAGLIDIDTSNALELLQLYCTKNELMELDVSCNSLLSRIGCAYNQLSSIDLSKNTKLTGLYLQYNLFDACALNSIHNQLPSRMSNVGTYNFRNTGNSGATTSNTSILIDKNWLPDVTGDASGCSPMVLTTTKNIGDSILIELRTIETRNVDIDWGNGNVSYQVSTESTQINQPLGSGNKIKIYGDNINFIKCEGSELTNVDISKGINLQQIYFGNNNLSEIDVTLNKNITRLGCSDNKITALNLSNNSKLSGLYLQENLMDACELNKIYTDISIRPTVSEIVNLRVIGNPGVTTSNTASAVAKNWYIDSTGDNTGCFTSFNDINIENDIFIHSFVTDFLEVKSMEPIHRITIFDMSGRMLNHANNTNVINMSKLAKGLYIVKIDIGRKQKNTIVIKE